VTTPDPSPPRPRVAVQPDGPYFVTGPLPVVRRRPIQSEHGEPLTWQTTARLAERERYALCRCGQSEAKPYCDGTHARVGFDGTEHPPAEGYDARATTYAGTRLVVRDDRRVCVHAGFCGNRVTNVWKMMSGDATQDSVVRGQVMAMVERCPSGALTYRLDEEGQDVEPELAAEVGVIDDGPLWVTGSVSVVGSDGQVLEVRNRVTLCRCGESATKPLCDGRHTQAGFIDH
jgi:CDGSH-type Zn-finger protein